MLYVGYYCRSFSQTQSKPENDAQGKVRAYLGMMMIGFDELSKRLNTDQGIGLLLSVKRIRRLSNITSNDLLECEDLEVLALQLESGMLYCLAKGMDDSIELYANMPVMWPDAEIADLSKSRPWVDILGTELFDAWTLQSHKGYYDAVQFSFAPIDDIRHRVVQIEVAASMFQVSIVEPIKD
jgi:hypothetical protein